MTNLLINYNTMKKRNHFKWSDVLPTAIKMASTTTSLEEQSVLSERRKTFKEYDAIKASKREPDEAFVKIFGREMLLPMEDIKKGNLKHYIK